jgi:metallo-beta-lactamase family protein
MKMEFYGAAGCVTGSCHILHVGGKKILLDCGLYQGKDEKDRGNEEFVFNAKNIDFVILSHAHIDHSGRIPLLYKRGFKGQVICTEATRDLCSVMLTDSGHIQEMEIEWKNRKRVRQGLEPVEPLYTAKIAELSLFLFKAVSYDATIELFEGFKVRFRNAGHLLGSSFVELFIKEENKEEVKIVYTGDVGNVNVPIIKDPTVLDYADYLIMETTYGDRLHDKQDAQFEKLASVIKETFANGGNVVIPSFAVGRAQELLFELDKYLEKHMFKDLTVFVDSPLAVQSTKIFEKYIDDFDEEAKQEFLKGNNFLEFKGLIFTNSPEDSIKINKIQRGAIIISASGMCEAGRIKHHLKHNLWRKECAIVFVGYQAEGTLGRAIVNGTKKVKLFGEEIAVNAKIYNLPGLSGHADRDGLINWVDKFIKKPKNILLVHGDKEAQQSFKELVKDRGYDAQIMEQGQVVYINESRIEDKKEVNDASNIKEKINDSNIKEKIIKLLDSIDNVDEINKESLLKQINDVIKNN